MNDLVKPYQENMQKTIDHLTAELAAVRAGRANPAVLDKITVDYYGTPTKINQMAAISVAEARILVISPWDPSTISKISKAIMASDIGINPTDDGRNLRLVFPQLTEERRKDLVKGIKKMGEEAKVAARNIRRDTVDSIKKAQKAGEITEDDQKADEDKIQKLTDKFVEKVDKTVEAKTKEIMTV